MRKILLLGSLGAFMLAGVSMGCGSDDDKKTESKKGEKCADNEELVDDECKKKCASDEERVKGECKKRQQSTCASDEELVGGKCEKRCASDEERVGGKCEKRCAADEERVNGKCQKRNPGQTGGSNENTPAEQVRLCKAQMEMEVRYFSCEEGDDWYGMSLAEQTDTINSDKNWCERDNNAQQVADNITDNFFTKVCPEVDPSSFETCASSMSSAATSGCDAVLNAWNSCRFNARCYE